MLFSNEPRTIEEYQRWIFKKLKTQQSARSYEPLKDFAIFDWLDSNLNFVGFSSSFRFSCRKISFQAKFFELDIIIMIRL